MKHSMTCKELISEISVANPRNASHVAYHFKGSAQIRQGNSGCSAFRCNYPLTTQRSHQTFNPYPSKCILFIFHPAKDRKLIWLSIQYISNLLEVAC